MNSDNMLISSVVFRSANNRARSHGTCQTNVSLSVNYATCENVHTQIFTEGVNLK
jgi:hypothetical protein